MTPPSGHPDGKQPSSRKPKPAAPLKVVQTNFVDEIVKYYPAEGQLLPGTRVEVYCPICHDNILILSQPSNQPPNNSSMQVTNIAAVACGHVFHDDCLDMSFRYKEPIQCPSCKLKIDYVTLEAPPMVLAWNFTSTSSIPNHALHRMLRMTNGERIMDPERREERDRMLTARHQPSQSSDSSSNGSEQWEDEEDLDAVDLDAVMQE
ncbi:hypothetical protein F5Y18DRAFT_444564 [Xylariaceae sp. FL1019]|nr:hypothetical protein F5Y18DRAFT_444564 [Xylariaceae sp. FL1019]